MKMNIAIFTDTFFPQINGIVTATINLSKGLSDRGHRVFIICPKFKNYEEKFKYKNVNIIRISSVPAYFYEDFRFASVISPQLIRGMKKEKIDIIHFQTPMTLGFQAILISKILRVPLVGTFHTFFSDPQYLKHMNLDYRFVENISWGFAKAYYNRCDLITAPSNETKKELIKNGFNEEIKVISNGIDFDQFDNSNKVKIKNKYNPDGDILLFVGRVANEKNLFYLLECFKIVVDNKPKTKLLIVGDGPQRNEVKDKIEELNLSKNVIMTGMIPHEEFVRSSIFGASKLFITASKTENQPMTMLEAQANGLVCIGLNERGIKNLIKNNHNGYLVKLGDKKTFSKKILDLLKDNKLYTKLKKNTNEEIKKHSLDEITKIWEKEYTALIKCKNHI